MTELEGPPKPPAKPDQRILTPEEDSSLAAELMAKMEKRLESALLPRDRSKDRSVVTPPNEAPDSDPALSLHPAPQVVDIPSTALDPSLALNTPDKDAVDGSQGTGKLRNTRRRATQKKQDDSITVAPVVAPVTPVSTVPSVPVPAIADATVTTATVDNKEPVIEQGRYKDEGGILCDVREENGTCYYTPLEGVDIGKKFSRSANRMKSLIQGWEKVADDTLPTTDTTAPADPVVLPQTPIQVPDVTLANTSVANVEAGKNKITVRELLKLVPDGGLITVKEAGAKGATKTFRRKGDSFATAKNEAKGNGQIISILTHGGTIVAIDGIPVAPDKTAKPDNSVGASKAPDVAPVPVADPTPLAPAVAPVATPPAPPVAPPAPATPPVATPAPAPVKMSPASPDATADASREKIKLPEKNGEILFYTSSIGRSALQCINANKYAFVTEGADVWDDSFSLDWAFMLAKTKTQDEILVMAKDQGWKQIDAPVMAPKAPDTGIDKPRFIPFAPEEEERRYSGKKGPMTVVAWGPGKYGIVFAGHTIASGVDETYVQNLASEQEWVPDTSIDDAVARNIQKQKIEKLLHKLAFANPSLESESIALQDEGILLLAEINVQPDEAKVQQFAERVQTLLGSSATSPAMPSVPPAMPPIPGSPKMEGFKPLPDGGREHYYIPGSVPGTGEAIVVERDGDGYLVTYESGVVPYSEEEIVEVAKTEGWQFYADGLRPEDFEQKTSREVALEEDERKIKDLRDLMEMMRLEYVSTDYNEKSKWPWLKRILGKGIAEQSTSKATEEAFERYNLALTRLKDAEIALLKGKKNLSKDEIRERMGQMIHFYDRQAVLDLALTRDQVKIESGNFPQKVISVAEEIGRRYNQLSRKQKFLIGGLCAGVGIATGAVGGAMAAGGVVFARRLLTTAGLAVTADTYLEGRQEKKQAEEFEVQKKKHLDILDTVGEKGKDEVYVEFERLLNDKMATLDVQFQAHKKQEGKRRVLAWGGATLVAFAGGAAVSGLIKEVVPDTSNLIDRVRMYNDMHSGGGTVSAVGGVPTSGIPGEIPSGSSFNDIASPDGPKPTDRLTFKGVSGVRLEDIITPGAGVVDGATPDSVPDPASEEFTFTDPVFLGNPSLGIPGGTPDLTASPESVTRVVMSREDYTVTSADGKKGLWGILEKRLPEGIPKGDQNRAIAYIQDLMRKDLALMSPAEQAEAGFAEGKLDLIHKGDVIQFDKFPSLTPERIQAIMDGQSVGAPSDVAEAVSLEKNEVGVADVVSAEEKAKILSDFKATAPTPSGNYDQLKVPLDTMPPMEPLPIPEIEIASSDSIAPSNRIDLASYMAEHPELTPSYEETLSGIKTDIFSMGPDVIPENGPYMARIDGNYQPGKHGSVFMGRVLETHRDLRTGEISPFEYDRRDYPFKSTQVDRLAHLVRTACHPKILGEAGRVLDGEKVDAYLKRIAMLATVNNKEREIAFLLDPTRRRLTV